LKRKALDFGEISPILKQKVVDFKLICTITIEASSITFGSSNKDKQGILMLQSHYKSFIRSKVMEVSTSRLALAHPNTNVF
uniref:Uncharacterized protein n=1 Tax=Romanomermis culicivorax TaxID=13658 RepID=A0A915JRP2_ROMCU